MEGGWAVGLAVKGALSRGAEPGTGRKVGIPLGLERAQTQGQFPVERAKVIGHFRPLDRAMVEIRLGRLHDPTDPGEVLRLVQRLDRQVEGRDVAPFLDRLVRGLDLLGQLVALDLGQVRLGQALLAVLQDRGRWFRLWKPPITLAP